MDCKACDPEGVARGGGALVIVIARVPLQGFMAVNEPSPRAQPEDKVCLRCHKSLATRAITVIYPI